MEKTTEQKYVGNFDEVFPIIIPKKLIWHRVLWHKPRTAREKMLMDNIKKGINLKLPAFRIAYMDPSEEDGKIVFRHGNKPAVGHSPIWWSETWKNFMPSKNSRSGTELHWAIFLGYLMKHLVDEKKYSVKDAWKAVCDDELFNISNTRKILERWEKSGFWFAGNACFSDKNNKYPLVHLVPIFYTSFDNYDSVGWLVMDV